MKKQEKEEIALVLFERNHLFLLISVLLSAVFAFWGYELLKDVNPSGFMIIVPAGILAFQSLWLILNPFAMIYENKIEIRQSLFHRKARYFVDIKKVSKDKQGKLYITYNDDEVEPLNLFGIRQSQRELFRTELGKFVAESLKTRAQAVTF